MRFADASLKETKRKGVAAMSARQKIPALSAMILLLATLARPALAQTGVFVSGRELSIEEVVQIQRCIPAVPGNYWMDGQGTCGYVGGGPVGNRITVCQQASLAGSSTVTPDGGTSTIHGNGSSTYYGPNSSFIYSPDGGCMVDGVSCPE
jgi:hypothetical protein